MGWRGLTGPICPSLFLNFFSPSPAKTVPFVILLSINARQSNASRESVPVCVWERVSWKFSTTIKVGSYRSELVVVCYSSELQTTNFKKRIVFDQQLQRTTFFQQQSSRLLFLNNNRFSLFFEFLKSQAQQSGQSQLANVKKYDHQITISQLRACSYCYVDMGVLISASRQN